MRSSSLFPARRGQWLALFATALLAACGGGEVARPGLTMPPPQRQRGATRYVPPPVLHRATPPSARVQALPGLEGVIGARQSELAREFGTPRLDVWEGDARKLQFSGTACVLDVYLYPPEGGGEPRATYVDARRATDGRDVDRAACVGALRGSDRKLPPR